MTCDAAHLLRSSRREEADLCFENPERLSIKPNPREFRDADALPLMVEIPAGEFTMGENEGDKFANDTERPAHLVKIVSGFALGKFPVTVAQFLQFRALVNPQGPSINEGDLPVVRVTWHDALAYCEWLTQETGRAYRLASEAEWEFACSAGRPGPFCFGHEISISDANFLYDENGTRVGLGYRTPVGNFAPNAFGLHDMHGNVCEWVADTWHPNYNGAPTEGAAWIEPDSSQRVIRGGAWDYLPRLLRSAWRDWRFDNEPADNIGFRVATSDLRILKET